MDIELVAALRDNVRRVLNDQCASPKLHRFIEDEAERYDAALWRTAAELGWLALPLAEEHGGLGAGIVELAALQEELGCRTAPVPFLSSVLVAGALQVWPHGAVRAHWLDKLASGDAIGAVGPLATAESGLAASQQNDLYRISGECVPVLDADIASLLLLPLQTEAGPGLALIDASTALDVQPLPVADRTRSVCTVQCHDLELPAQQLITGSEAASLCDRLAGQAQILLAADSVGGAQATLEMTIEYMKTRVQFGKPIGTFQALKHRCADHKLAIETSRRILQRAALEYASGGDRAWPHMAKFAACDCYTAMAADGIQLHGGIGFTAEHNAHLFLKRSMLNQYLFGDSAQQLDLAGRKLMSGEHGA